MQKFSPKLKIFLCSGLILTAIAIILFTVSMFTVYDSGPNYFNRSIIVSVATAISVISLLIFLCVFLFIPKGALDGGTPRTTPVTVSSVLCALVFAAVGIILILCSIGSLSFFTGIKRGALSSICGICCIACAVYFIANCLVAPDENNVKHTLSGFFLPISTTLLIAISYFDHSVSMNAPIKAMFHLSSISFMIWILYELRAMIGKQMPRAYFASGLCTMLLSGIASLPYIVYAIGGGLGDPVYPTYIIYNVVSFAIFVYSTVRIIIFVCARDLLERISDQTADIEYEYEDIAESPAEDLSEIEVEKSNTECEENENDEA